MANTKSAKKSVKTNERNRVRNLDTRTAIKTAFKKAGEAIKSHGDTASALSAAASLIDKAVVRGIIHANTAARKKSRLAKKANAAAQA